MNKIRRSEKLLKAAFAVLFREKKLLLFPIIASCITLAFALFFFAPIAFYPTGHSYFSAAHWHMVGENVRHNYAPPSPRYTNDQIASGQMQHDMWKNIATSFMGGGRVIFQNWWSALSFAAYYFTLMFLGTFFNVAFYHEIMQVLNGNAVSVLRGYRFAKTRWRAILWWSLLAGLVGYLIRIIEQRVGFLGKFITALIGFAWSLASIFVIPTLVRDTETTNPLQLLRNSAGTLKRTWGETVIGFVGMEAVLIFFMLPIFLAIGFISGFTHQTISPLLMFLAMFLMIFPLSWIVNVVNSVYRCALYIYATEGVVPGTFDKELLDSAWKVK
jgi:hypothetical protein